MKFVQRSGYIITGFYGVWVPCMPKGRQHQWDIHRLKNQGTSVYAVCPAETSITIWQSQRW